MKRIEAIRERNAAWLNHTYAERTSTIMKDRAWLLEALDKAYNALQYAGDYSQVKIRERIDNALTFIDQEAPDGD